MEVKNTNWRDKGRCVIYEMGGLYLLYIAYKMIDSYETSTLARQAFNCISIGVFIIAGIGLIAFGLVQMYKRNKG